MIDLNYIKEHTEEAKEVFKKRGCTVDVDEFLRINNELNLKKSEMDKLRSEQRKSDVEQAKEIKKDISNLK